MKPTPTPTTMWSLTMDNRADGLAVVLGAIAGLSVDAPG